MFRKKQITKKKKTKTKKQKKNEIKQTKAIAMVSVKNDIHS